MKFKVGFYMKINTDKGKNVYFKCNYDIFLQKIIANFLKCINAKNHYVKLVFSLNPGHILQILLNYD